MKYNKSYPVVVTNDVAHVDIRGDVVLVDYDMLDEFLKYRWFIHPKKKYVRCNIGKYPYRTTMALTRLTMGLSPEDMEVDHINRNPLDNRRINLRFATDSQNKINSKLRIDSNSGFKGVEMLPSGKWRTYIRINGKQTHLGVFNTKVEAARMYNKIARIYFREYACLNEV